MCLENAGYYFYKNFGNTGNFSNKNLTLSCMTQQLYFARPNRATALLFPRLHFMFFSKVGFSQRRHVFSVGALMQ